MKPVATRDSSRVGLKPATVRIRGSRVKPIARPKRNPLESHRTLRAPTMGLFSFSQYGLLNKSQRLRLQRARSHRCRRQPPDSACAHGDPPRAQKRHGSLQPQTSLVCFNDVHSGDCSPRAVPWRRARTPVAAADKSLSTLGTVGANSGGWATGAEASFRRIAHDAATPPTPQ